MPNLTYILPKFCEFCSEVPPCPCRVSSCVTLSQVKGELFSLAWSPDGKYLAAAGHDLHLLNANTGSIVATYHAAMGTWMENLAWSPDSTMVAGESYILDNPTAYVSAWHVK